MTIRKRGPYRLSFFVLVWGVALFCICASIVRVAALAREPATRYVQELCFSDDGETVAAVTFHCNWRGVFGGTPRSYAADRRLTVDLFSVTTGGMETVAQHDVAFIDPPHQHLLGRGPRHAAFVPGETSIVYAAPFDGVFLYDYSAGQRTPVAGTQGLAIRAIAVHPKGRWIAYTAGRHLMLHDRQTGGVASRQLPKASMALAFTHDGQWLLAAFEWEGVQVWQVQPLRPVTSGTIASS